MGISDMQFYVSGLSHKTAPIQIRESISRVFGSESLDLISLFHEQGIVESVVISTCNRFELYAVTEKHPEQLLSGVFARAGVPSHVLYTHRSEAAIRHLCRVAVGLDSLVIGEPQILGQLKTVYAAALQNGQAGSRMQTVFPAVFSLAKKVRTKTSLGQSNISVAYIAVKMAEQHLGTLAGVSVMIIGAGEATVRNLRTKGAGDVYVVNRTYQRAVELADRLHATPVMFHEIPEYLPKVDVLISSVGSPTYVVTPTTFNAAQRKALFVVDISVPRSIDPALAEVSGVHLCNIDDLEQTVAKNLQVRTGEVDKTIEIINEHIPEIARRMGSCDVVPVIASLHSQAEIIRSQLIAEWREKATGEPQEYESIERFSRTLVARILHFSSNALRDVATTLDKDR
jgi:glutamyl-tRNA reductase